MQPKMNGVVASPGMKQRALRPIGRSGEQERVWRGWRRFCANRLALGGGAFIILLCLMAVFADLVAPHDPMQIVPGHRGVGPSWDHPLGFDQMGRDLLSRVIFGTRVALIVGLSATVLTVTIGVIIGAVAGYFGGWPDRVLSRITDTVMAFPLFVLLILLASLITRGLWTTSIVIGVTAWAQFARVIRAEVLSLKEQDFILAAHAIGGNSLWIIGRHVLPNVLAPVIVLATLGIGGVIILAAALSFFGLGIPPPTPCWGGILADGRGFMRLYPHISIAPGIMILLTVLAFNFFGDGLRDALDPRQTDPRQRKG